MTDFSLCPRIPKSGVWLLLCYPVAANSPGLTQHDVLLWGHFKTQMTQIRSTARLMRTIEMRHTCLWTSETHDNGQKRGGSDEKIQKFRILLGILIDTDLCGIFHLHFDSSFCSTDHKYPRLTRFMKNDAVRKLANYKDHARGHYKAYAPRYRAQSNFRGLSTLLITSRVPVNSAKGSQLQHAWQCYCQIIPRMIWYSFICNFSDCVIFHKLVSNVVCGGKWSTKM